MAEARVSADILTATHPVYDLMIGEWIRNLDMYEGTNLRRYLDRHDRERKKSYEARAQRIIYRNMCNPVVELYVHYIFSKTVTRSASRKEYEAQKRQQEEAKQQRREEQQKNRKVIPISSTVQTPQNIAPDREWEEWLKNVDRRGNPIDRFMAEAERWADIYGHVFVVVDMPYVANPPKTEAERKAQKLSPYASLYYPTEATNWGVDEDWNLTWIRFREPTVEGENPFPSASPMDKRNVSMYADQTPDEQGKVKKSSGTTRYRTFTKNEWFLHEVKGNTATEIRKGTHPLGRVPALPIFHKKSARYPVVGTALLSDIAGINKEILNVDSLIQEAIFQQTINLLALGRQGPNRKNLEVGEENTLEYTGNPPFYLTPSSAPIAFMEDRIQRMREEVSRIAKLGGGLGLEPRSTPSGVAMAYEFNESNAVLSEKADHLEAAEDTIHELWYKWMGKEWNGIVDYPNDFSVQSFQEEMDLVTKGKTTFRSPTMRRELEKRAAKRILKNIAEDVADQIDFETDFIPEITDTFSGPIFYDPMMQKVNTPTPTGAAVGTLGAIEEQLGAQPPTPEQEQLEQIQQQQQQPGGPGGPQKPPGGPTKPTVGPQKPSEKKAA